MNTFESKLSLICKHYELHQFMPNTLHKKYELFLQAEHNKHAMKSVAGIGLSLGLLYFISPLFSKSGLSGVAAYNNGLANLGGFAIATIAGYGLACWFTYKSADKILSEFLNAQPRIFQDTIFEGNYVILADFKLENGKFTFLKDIRVYENNKVIFGGYISRKNGNLIIEKRN